MAKSKPGTKSKPKPAGGGGKKGGSKSGVAVPPTISLPKV